MRAAVFEPEQGFRLRQVPDPEPSESEVLIGVESCGVCGSDRQITAGAHPPTGTRFPAIFGHEIPGYVAAAGAGWSAGDRVVVFPLIPCGKCRLCRNNRESLCLSQEVIGYHRPGGYAEMVAVPQDRLIRLPDGVSTASAGLLVDALATPFHALRSVARLDAGESVVVIGSGGLGLGALVSARAMGAQGVALVTRQPDPGEVARIATAAGAELVWSSAGERRRMAREVRRWSGGGADVVLDAVGTGESVALGMELLRPGGKLCVVGMGEENGADANMLPSMSHWVRRGIEIAGSYGSTIEDVRTLVSCMESGRIEPDTLDSLVSGVFPLCGIADAFAEAGRSGRVVIQP